MTLDLGKSLREVKGIGPARQRQLAEEGVGDVGALLCHVPSRYEDRRQVTDVAEVAGEGSYTFEGRLRGVRLALRRGRRFSLVRGTLEDSSGVLPVVWFNRPYLPRQVDPDADYILHGEVRQRQGELELLNPSCERLAAAVHSGRIVPVYAALGPLGPALVRRLLAGLVAEWDLCEEVEDPIPAEILEARSLAPLGAALESLHRPAQDAAVEDLNRRAGRAHRRLIYGELFAFQLRLAQARARACGRTKNHRVRRTAEVDRLVQACLPFELTPAQARVIDEVLADLASERPMRRLVQGDVGSGKTAVAAAAFVATIESGLQAAFMAPTELLAEQHYATLNALLGDRYQVVLVTGSTSGSAMLEQRLRDGTVDLAIGTQALIQRTIEFRRLGLAVVDEQHRFGVSQRTELGEKGDLADLLVMTATPIPRTLTLTAYGDLDLSLIDQLPPGRSAVTTEVVSQDERPGIHDRLLAEVETGGRVYVVYPAIHRNADGDGVSLEEGVAWISERFPELGLGVMSGRTPAEERLRIMQEFASGQCQVLLSTTVIEVGVDVPEATLMVIEGAERFGLAQLHQLRGRVGRGESHAHCVALHGDLTPDAARRLEVFARTSDGFEIAEEDLAIRGPGELLGKRQAGVPGFRLADLRTDGDLLEAARDDARRLAARLGTQELQRLLRRIGGDLDEESSPRLARG